MLDKFAMVLIGIFFSLAAVAGGEFITLQDGTVISVPSNGQTCKFDPVYCLFGWKEDGTFPGVMFGAVVQKQLDTCANEARNYPVCPTGRELSLGGRSIDPYPCYELITSEDD